MLVVLPASHDDVRAMRDRYREEMDCQIVHDSLHARPGWTIEHRIVLDDVTIGYGSIAVGGPWRESPTLFEFHVDRAHRGDVCACFERLLETTGVSAVETQTNDARLTAMLLAYGRDVTVQSVLFEDAGATHLPSAGVVVRAAMPADATALASAGLDTGAAWVATLEGEVVAAGGVLYHYNRPYGDVYVAVAAPFRRRGIGAFLVQELKRVCRGGGSVPAARCAATNVASRRTLQRAGFVPCGGLLTGTVAR